MYIYNCYESSPRYRTFERNKRQWIQQFWVFANVHWLNCVRVLQRFTGLSISIQDFLETKGMLAKYSTVKDKNDSVIYIFLQCHSVHEWNKSEAFGKGKLTFGLARKVLGFTLKLHLFTIQINNNEFAYFCFFRTRSPSVARLASNL